MCCYLNVHFQSQRVKPVRLVWRNAFHAKIQIGIFKKYNMKNNNINKEKEWI